MKRYIFVFLFLVSITTFSQEQRVFDKHHLVLSHSFIDQNVKLLDNELTKFDSSLSHIVRVAYQNELSKFWAFTAGFNNGFYNNVFLDNQYNKRTYALGLDYQVILKLARENARLTPFITFGNRLDYHVSKEYKNEWWLQNIYGAGLNIRLSNQIKLQYQISMDQLMANDFNTSLQHRFGFLFNLKPKKHFMENKSNIVDTDGDGIPDNEDLCPETFGFYEFKGCPESVVVISLKDFQSLEDELMRLEIELSIAKDDDIESEVADDEEIKDVEIKNDIIEITEDKVEKTDKLDDGSLQVDEYYFITTLSIMNLSVAENYRKKLENHFPDTRIIPLENGFYRVGVYAGRDKSSANQLLEKVKGKGYTSWISVENHKE